MPASARSFKTARAVLVTRMVRNVPVTKMVKAAATTTNNNFEVTAICGNRDPNKSKKGTHYPKMRAFFVINISHY